MKIIRNRSLVIMTFVSLLTVICFIRCEDDYLATLPDARTALDSPGKISELLVNAYPRGGYAFMAETMSDNTGDKGPLADGAVTDNNWATMVEDLYAWRDVNLEDESDTPFDYWKRCYEAIAHANYALQAIEDLGGGTEFNAQKGEALVARAYAHFMLVNFWGEHYNPANTISLGIPYERKPETTALGGERKRETVVEVYKRVEEDLLAGLELVGETYGQPKYHFTKASSYAFATRFYLYKGDWDKVIEYANLALVNPESQIRDEKDTYSTLTYNQQIALFISDRESANALLVNTFSIYRRLFDRARYALSAAMTSTLFSGGHPIAGKAWAYRTYNGGNDITINLPKIDEQFVVAGRGSGIGTAYVTYVLFSYDETLLARAEAYAMKGDFASALVDINRIVAKKTSAGTYRSTDVITDAMVLNYTNPAGGGNFSGAIYTLTPYYTMTENQKRYAILIAEIRRRVYYFEGLRWFDIKRFHIPVTHRYAEGNTVTLSADDPKRVLQIPQRVQSVAGLKPNPR